MAEIGETLREARMRRRIDMTEVETATKIRAKYLRALESEEWELLPGPTFVKTFLRTYADYLELDSRLLVEEYKQRFERPAGVELTPLNLRRQGRRRRVMPRLGPGLVVLAGVIALLAALYLLGSLGGNNNNSDAPAVRSETPTPTATPRKPHRKRSAVAAAGRPVALKIVPTGTVYVCLEDGKGRALVNKATLEAGRSTRTFRGRRFRVTFGTNAARMRIDGKTYTVASSRGPVGYEIRSGHRPRRLTSGLASCT